MPEALAAAHIAHEIEHSSALMGFLIGAAVGLLVGVAIVATVASGGAALAVIAAVGGAVASTGGGALAGKYIGEAIKNPKGPISSGSPNVFYGPARKAAARAIIDTVACKDHGTKFLATGSDSVFINEYPSVRDDDKSECDGTVHSDITHIFIGAETVQYLEIDPEVPEWMVNLAEGMVIVGGTVALVFGAAAALAAGGICALINFGGSVLGGMLGSAILAPLGGMIGEALFGEVGKRVGETGFGFLGGLFGGGIGNRMASGHPVDVATGELFTTNAEFVIGGLISVTWERFWISSSTQQGALGPKWHHPLDMAMAPAGSYWVLRLEAGRLILLPDLKPGQSFYHRAEKLVATRLSESEWSIRKSNGLTWLLQSDPSGRVPYRLAEIRDDNRNRLSVSYDGRGNMAEVVATDGIRYQFISDRSDRIIAIERLAGKDRARLVSYEYDDKGDLIAATDRSGVPFSYEYARHLIVRETRRSGLAFYFQWDDVTLGTAARCIKTWGDGNIYYREFEYQPAIAQTRARNFSGATETYVYNDIGLVVEVTTPLGHRSARTFNRYAEILSSTDANGVETRWQRDAYGRAVSFVGPDGAQTSYEYASDNPQSPAFDAVSREVNAEGGETTAEYDARGNLVAYTDPLGYNVHILRDQRGLPLSQQDAEGVLERLSWNSDGNLREHRSSKGGGIRYEYDHLGRLVQQQVEGIDPVTYEYDAQDRPTTTRLADGTSTTQVYDADGRVVQVTQPGGQVHRWEYRGLPDPVLRINPDGTRFAYEYDTELNLIALRNEVGDVYRREYDADQRLICEVGFDGRNQEFGYDPSGCIIHATDGARWHSFSRDKAGRLLRRESSDGSWSTFAYDKMGRLTRADNPARKLAFAYDPRGLLLSEVQDGQDITHAYAPRGQRITTVLPDGRFFGFGYDQNGSFERLTFAGREVLSLSRDRIGRERLRNAGHVRLQTDYDPQGRMSQQLAYREGRQGPVFGRSFGHDRSGLIDRISDLARGDRRFAYDPREQLLDVMGDSAERFSFDPAGNLLKDIEDPRDASVQQGRLMMRGDNHYEYDDAGNRITHRRGQAGAHVYHYDYDALNQLTGIWESKGRTQRSTQFAYDALGRRISKSHTEVMTAANLSRGPGHGKVDDAPEMVRQDTTWFLWNGDVMLAEGKGDQAGAADPLAVVYVFEPDSFRPAAQIRRHSPENEGEVLIYWVDHLGTPQEITNERGELVWQVALKAWGGIDQIFHERIENNIRFQGQYHDVETGLHYSRFRHYDPSAGCFINQDPIGLLGGYVLAGYVGNPNQWYDPLGLNGWNDHQHNNPGKTSTQNSQTYTPNPPRTTTGGTNGNTLNNRPAVLYAITDKDGNFQKWGITQHTGNPRDRYITIDGKQMDVRHLPRDYRIERVAIGTRSEMAALERSLTSQAGGPHNREPHSSFRNGKTSTLAGLRERIRAGDPRFTERQRLAINNALSMGCKF